jgi:hypothetical protein
VANEYTWFQWIVSVLDFISLAGAGAAPQTVFSWLEVAERAWGNAAVCFSHGVGLQSGGGSSGVAVCPPI